jgi:hypothetical protein
MLSRFTSSVGAGGSLQMITVSFLLVVLGASRMLAALRRRDTLRALGASRAASRPAGSVALLLPRPRLGHPAGSAAMTISCGADPRPIPILPVLPGVFLAFAKRGGTQKGLHAGGGSSLPHLAVLVW